MEAEPSQREVRIVERSSGSAVPATLVRDFPHARLDAVEAEWGPARRAGAAWAAAQGRVAEHGHWDWRNKAWDPARHRLYAVECDDAVQGLMAVLRSPRRSRLADRARRVLYVDYLEVAPWNLSELCPNPRFGFVGVALLDGAVAVSTESGWGGRVGLHALEGAESFYVRKGMTSFGPDPD